MTVRYLRCASSVSTCSSKWRLFLFLSSSLTSLTTLYPEGHVHFLPPRSLQSDTSRVKIAHICQTPWVIMQRLIIWFCESGITEGWGSGWSATSGSKSSLAAFDNQDHKVFLQRKAGRLSWLRAGRGWRGWWRTGGPTSRSQATATLIHTQSRLNRTLKLTGGKKSFSRDRKIIK